MNPSSISSALRHHAHPADSGTTGAIAAMFAGDAATTPFNDQLAQLNPLLRAASASGASAATAASAGDSTPGSSSLAATADQPEADAMANWIKDWLPATDSSNPLAARSYSIGKARGREGARPLAGAPGLNGDETATSASARNIDTLPTAMGNARTVAGTTTGKPARVDSPLSGRPEMAAEAAIRQPDPAAWQAQAVTGESTSDRLQKSALQPTLAEPLQAERADPVAASGDVSVAPRSLHAKPVQPNNDNAGTANLQALSTDATLVPNSKVAEVSADEAPDTSRQPEPPVGGMPAQLAAAARVVAPADIAEAAEPHSLARSTVGESAGDIGSNAGTLAPGLHAAQEVASVPVLAASKPSTPAREIDQKSAPQIFGPGSPQQTAEGEAAVADTADELPRQQKAARTDTATDPIAPALMATLPVPASAIVGIDARPRGQQARTPSEDRPADKGWSTSAALPAHAAAVSVAASAPAGTSTRSAATTSATSTTHSGESVTGPLNPGARTAHEPANGASFAKALELAAQPHAVASQGPGATYSAPSTAAPLEMRFDTPLESPEFRSALGVQVSVLARDGVQHAELSLNPAEMGPISVRIALDGNQAHVEFGVDSAATRAVLESGLPELASALREAGLTLTGGGVSEHARQQADGAPQRQSGDSQGQQGRQGHARAEAGRAEAEADTPRDQLRPRRAQLAGGVDMYA